MCHWEYSGPPPDTIISEYPNGLPQSTSPASLPFRQSQIPIAPVPQTGTGGTQQQEGGYDFAGQYNPNLPSGYGTDYQTFGGPMPAPIPAQSMPEPMPMVRRMPAPVAPQPMPMPVQQPQPAMMPSKGGMNLPVQQPMPAPMPMVQPIPQAQPMPAMMPSKGGMPAAQFNPQPVPPIQSPSITPSRQIRSPLGPRNMRYGR